LSIYPLSITINTPTPLITNTTTSFTWAWIKDRQVIPVWYVDLYTAGEETPMFTGRRIGTVNSPGMGLTWTIPADLPSGVYFLRVYGYRAGEETDPNMDPYSSISTIFNIRNAATDPQIRITSLTPSNSWWSSAYVNVSWTVESNPSNISITGFHIDMYKNTAPYKRIHTLTTSLVNPNKTWEVVQAPAGLIRSVDYQVRVRAVLPTPNDIHDIGAVSSMFSVIDKPASTTFGTSERPINYVGPESTSSSSSSTTRTSATPRATTNSTGSVNIGLNAGRRRMIQPSFFSLEGMTPFIVPLFTAVFLLF
jgi:hypothetical protein